MKIITAYIAKSVKPFMIVIRLQIDYHKEM